MAAMTAAMLDYQQKNKNSPEVIFHVFKDNDSEIYKQLLG